MSDRKHWTKERWKLFMSCVRGANRAKRFEDLIIALRFKFIRPMPIEAERYFKMMEAKKGYKETDSYKQFKLQTTDK
jgi:hypothetical protein